MQLEYYKNILNLKKTGDPQSNYIYRIKQLEKENEALAKSEQRKNNSIEILRRENQGIKQQLEELKSTSPRKSSYDHGFDAKTTKRDDESSIIPRNLKESYVKPVDQEEAKDVGKISTLQDLGTNEQTSKVAKEEKNLFRKTQEIHRSFGTTGRTGIYSYSPNRIPEIDHFVEDRRKIQVKSPSKHSAMGDSYSKGESFFVMESGGITENEPAMRPRMRPSTKNFEVHLKRNESNHNITQEDLEKGSVSEIKEYSKKDEFLENFNRFKQRIAELKADCSLQSKYTPGTAMFPPISASMNKLPKVKLVRPTKFPLQEPSDFATQGHKTNHSPERLELLNKVSSKTVEASSHIKSNYVLPSGKRPQFYKISNKNSSPVSNEDSPAKNQSSQEKIYSSQAALDRNLVLKEYEKYKRNHKLSPYIGNTGSFLSPAEREAKAKEERRLPNSNRVGAEAEQAHRLKKLFNIYD